MADGNAVDNGGFENEDRAESFYELDQRENEDKLKEKVEALEQEKLSLMNENDEMKAQAMRFKAEVDSLKSEELKLRSKVCELEREREMSKDGMKALDAIAQRAQQLETEVVRLQHDLISAESAGADANSAVSVMKKLLAEKEASLEELKREKQEEEKKVRDLERKIGDFEDEEKRNKVKMEKEMREKLAEKEKEIDEYKKKLQSSEEKLKVMEGKIVEMQKKVVEAEVSIDGLKERSMEAVNGLEGQSTEKTRGLKVDTPVVAVGLAAAVLATAAVVWVRYSRRA